MGTHKIDVNVYKGYQFERVIAGHTGSDGLKTLAVICDVWTGAIEYEVRKQGKPYGERTGLIERAVEVYNSI